MDVESILKQVDIVSGDSKYLACCCCHIVTLTAKVAACGHLFCTECIDVIFSDNGKVTCPVDKQDIQQGDFEVKRDHKLKVMCLLVACPNKRKGCVFQGKLHEMKYHLNNCGDSARIVPVPVSSSSLCPQGCKASVDAKDIPFHLQNECPLRYVLCNFCTTPVPFSKYQEHSEKCDCFPLVCRFNCGQTIPRFEMAEHERSCAQRLNKCKFSELGCTFQGHGLFMQQHEQNAEIHLDILLNANLKCKILMDCALAKMQGNIEELKNENVMLKTALDDSEKTMEVLKNFATQMFQKLTGIQKALKTGDYEWNGTDEVEADAATAMMEQMGEIHTSVQNIDKDLQASKAAMKQSQQDQNTELMTLLQSRKLMKKPTYSNGTFVWRLRDFTKLLVDAASGECVSFFSDPFYTHEFGYKMNLLVFPNGDGSAVGSYLSVYTQAAKSEMNAMLIWPVQYNATITLLSNDANLHYKKAGTFLTDRPVAEYGSKNGFQHFIALDEIKAWYLHQDSLFLKVKIEVLTKNV